MQTDHAQTSDAAVIELAAAERDAGVPDVQTAEAAAAAQQRTRVYGKHEAHPS